MWKLLFLLLTITLISTANSQELSKEEKMGELSFQTINFIDMLQTVEIVEHGDKWYETNPILGKHPQTSEVITYFMLRGAAHYQITRWLPKELRIPWLSLTVFTNFPVIKHNHAMGIRIRW